MWPRSLDGTLVGEDEAVPVAVAEFQGVLAELGASAGTSLTQLLAVFDQLNLPSSTRSSPTPTPDLLLPYLVAGR